ncbi:MAG: hypothetical protein GWN32_02345 [Gemmatimonadetes bacterium]|nr:hypothetical protein [Gemmatimonadota bacterium]
MSRRRKQPDPDQYDLFEPHHECCEDSRGPYLQFLIAPPTELVGPAPWADGSGTRRRELEARCAAAVS